LPSGRRGLRFRLCWGGRSRCGGAAIVGPEGSGKTTWLLEFAERASDGGFRPVVRRAGEPVPSLGPRDILLLDSAERLGWAA
jgi:hypothetical protein